MNFILGEYANVAQHDALQKLRVGVKRSQRVNALLKLQGESHIMSDVGIRHMFVCSVRMPGLLVHFHLFMSVAGVHRRCFVPFVYSSYCNGQVGI